MELSSGEKLGPYEIVSALGAGGMGEVYKAIDSRLGRIVAIKRLKEPHSQRFLHEARAIAALNHPNICTLYDVGPNYLVMEYIDGVPLRGKFPPGEAVGLAIEIASALEEAHCHGLLHRDLKPDNILLTAKGTIKLLDFGIAKMIVGDATATMAQGAVGTAAYMSPEQAQSRPLGVPSDIFSFGAVLYEMLSGKSAFRADSLLDTMNAVVNREPASLDVLPSLANIVFHCLKKAVPDRFQTMAEVRSALRNLAPLQSTSRPQQSIAILAFANLSHNGDDEYFSDGLAEEIINLLARIPSLKVIARTSSFVFKGQSADIRTIAGTLGVSNLLEGSVRRVGSRIRVTAQLITAADGSNLWSGRYDRELVDVFAVQDEIASAISAALHVSLAPGPARKRHPPVPAYEALLKARHLHWQLTPPSLVQAELHYQDAIRLDPDYALARAYYADYLIVRTTIGLSSMRAVEPAARALAQRALELDEALPEAHCVLGLLAAMHDFDWPEAARLFRLAMPEGVASAWTHMCHGQFLLLASGRRTEALVELKLAVDGDPLQLLHSALLATCEDAAGLRASAESRLRQSIGIAPDFHVSHSMMAMIYIAGQMYTEAFPYAEKAFALAPWDARAVGLYAGLLARNGERARARELTASLAVTGHYSGATGLAFYYCCVEETDSAANWFQKAIEERDPMVGALLQSAIATAVRSSPRWQRLAALMNLPA